LTKNVELAAYQGGGDIQKSPPIENLKCSGVGVVRTANGGSFITFQCQQARALMTLLQKRLFLCITVWWKMLQVQGILSRL